MLQVDKINTYYGLSSILEEVSLRVGDGEAVTLLGRNGAGKTTTLRSIMGLTPPKDGSIFYNGEDVTGAQPFEVARKGIAYVPETRDIFSFLTARENLAFAAKLWGIVDPERVEELLDRVGVVRWQDQRVATFSRGMTQRLAIARALIHQPDILLLDEPFHSLDDPGVADVVRLLGELVSEGRGRGRAIVLVTHQLERLVQLATSVGYLVHGTLVGPEPMDDRSVETIAARYRGLLNRA